MSKVSIILGSKSDLPVAEKAEAVLKRLGVPFEVSVASAHRTPARVQGLVEGSDADVFIAIAGLSAALPGVVASFTVKPVVGVPVSGAVNLDAILSVVQMPPGVPVACVGLDRGDNAAVLACEMLALTDPDVAGALVAYRAEMAAKVEADSEEVSRLAGCRGVHRGRGGGPEGQDPREGHNRLLRRGGQHGRRDARQQGGWRQAAGGLRGQRPHEEGRDRGGRGDARGDGHQLPRGAGRRRVLRGPQGGLRPGGQEEDHRGEVHQGLREGG